MNFTTGLSLAVLLSLAICIQPLAAKEPESHGSAALRVYYDDLNQKLSQYDFDDVPFKQRQVKVASGDTLLRIAKKQRFKELDFYHLAAAIHEVNSHAFVERQGSQLKPGSTIKLPTVWELFLAQSRYEKLKVVGDELDFTGEDNQMRAALRWPFGKSLVLIGPYARDELPSNQLVTLTSYRPDMISTQGDTAAERFLSNAPNVSGTNPNSESNFIVERSAASSDGSWLDQLDESAPSIVLNDSVGTPVIDMGVVTEPMETESVTEIKAVAQSQVSVQKAAAARVSSAPVTELEAEIEAEIASATPVAQVATPVAEVAMPVVKTNTEPTAGSITAVDVQSLPDPVAASAIDGDDADNVLVAAVAAVSPSGISDHSPSVVRGSNLYLGPPRGSEDSASDVSTDPLSYVIEWDVNDNASIGDILNRLADFIGYDLISDDSIVLDTYSRELPVIQRDVKGVTVEEGFAILAGRGLQTVFDHLSRSVKHVPIDRLPATPAPMVAIPKETHLAFVEQSGIAAMLKQFPLDIESAAGRHARRCDSTPVVETLDANKLHSRVVGTLQEKSLGQGALTLVDWYNSVTGRKVLELERGQINDKELQGFSLDEKRGDRIERIYNNTVTGKGIASVAVELDYAGWRVSGCKQMAERSDDVQQFQREMVYGQQIKKKAVKLESILKDDMLHSMGYLFSSLNDRELTEYSEITQQYRGIFSMLQQSVVEAIAAETNEVLSRL